MPKQTTTNICPHCKANLKKTGIYELQYCLIKWDLAFKVKDNRFTYTKASLAHPAISDGAEATQHYCCNCEHVVKDGIDFNWSN